MDSTPPKRPIAIDLFAGAGGLSLGFEQAGFDIAAAVELDPIHAAVHEFNFPYSKTICRDIRDLSGEQLRGLAGLDDTEIDVVVGGPPCQGFSLMGYRVLEDPRNELVFHFLRMVRQLQPKAFMMENVPGMVTGKHTQLLTELIGGFESAGYRVRLPYKTLSATHHGVPQERRRLFLMGARSDVRLPCYPAPSTVPRVVAGRRQGTLQSTLSFLLPPCPSVQEAIGDLPDVDAFDTLLETDELRVHLTGGSSYARRLRGDEPDPFDYSYHRLHEPDLLTGCQRARHTPLSRQRFRETTPGTTEPVSRFYRLHPEGISNTLRAGTATDRGAFTSPRPIHPVHPRCITVREAARLHSYPDWFRFHCTIWHGFRQVGNSVPPFLARAVGQSVAVALEVRPTRPQEAIRPCCAKLVDFNMREAAAYFGVSHTVIPPRQRSSHSAS